MAAIFRQAEDVAVGEPGELGGELVALALGRRDGHGEPVREYARDVPFQSAQVIHIGDHPFAGLAADRRDQRHAAGRHVDHLAGKFAPVRQHVAAQEVDADALKPPTFLAERAQLFLGERDRHAALHFRVASVGVRC